MSDQGHWVGQKADPHNNFGFIYLIEDLTTGKAYVGKRQYWLAKPRVKGCKSKVSDKSSPKWKASCWTESPWRDYRGSSKDLAKWQREFPSHEYRYTILEQFVCRGDLVYGEVKWMWEFRVLEAQLLSGERKFFNKNIPAVKFIPQLARRKLVKYTFTKGSTKYTGTLDNFRTAYPELTERGLSKLIAGKQRTHKGWRYERPSRNST